MLDKRCPLCREILYKADSGFSAPAEGDFTICTGCAAFLKYRKAFVLSTEDDRRELLRERPESFHALIRTQRALAPLLASRHLS